MTKTVGRFPRLRRLFADHGDTGPLLAWIKDLLGWDTEIVPKTGSQAHQKWVLIDGKPVCVPLPKGASRCNATDGKSSAPLAG